MEHVCGRCMRHLLLQAHPRPSRCVTPTRLLSSTAARGADNNDSTPKVQHVDLSASLGRQTSAADEAAYKADVEKSGAAREYNKMRPRITYDNLPARKIHAYDPADNAARRPGPAAAAARSSSPQAGAANWQRGGQSLPGPLLQRSRPGNGASRGGHGGRGRGRGGRALGRGGNFGAASGGGHARRTRISNADDEDDEFADLPQGRRRGGRRQSAADEDGSYDPDEDLDDPALDIEDEPSPAEHAAFEREVARLPSDNPTTVQPYNPEPPSLSDLEKYWPNTPLSPTGLRASVTQQLAPLANRQTTSFWTPLQLAEQFVSGQLVSLHSEREKQEMMKFVPRLLEEKAEAVQKYVQIRSERDGSGTFNADAFLAKRRAAGLPDTRPDTLPEFVSLADGKSRHGADAREVLINQMVKGRYEHPNRAVDEAKWGKMKWIGEVERKLAVNETYSPADQAKFLGRLTEMVKEMQQQAAGRGKAKKQVQ